MLRNGNHSLEASSVAIDSRRRREDNVLDAMFVHHTDKVDGSGDVDVVVLGGDLGRLADGLRSSRSAFSGQ